MAVLKIDGTGEVLIIESANGVKVALTEGAGGEDCPCNCADGLCTYYLPPCVRLTFADFVIDDGYEHDCKECEYLNTLSVVLHQTVGDPCVWTKTISCGSCIDNQSDIVFTFTATAVARTLTVYKLYALDLQASVAAVNNTDPVEFDAASFTVFSGCNPAGAATIERAPCGEVSVAPCRGTVFNGATAQLDRWPLSILLTPQNFVDVYQGSKESEAIYLEGSPCPVNEDGVFLGQLVGSFGGLFWNGLLMDSNTSPAVLERISASCQGAVYRGASQVCNAVIAATGTYAEWLANAGPEYDFHSLGYWEVHIGRGVVDEKYANWYLRVLWTPFGEGRHLECDGQVVLNADCGLQNQVFVDGWHAPGRWWLGEIDYVSGNIDTIAGAGRVSTNCCPDELLNRVYPMVAYFNGYSPEQYDAGTHLLFTNTQGFQLYTLWLQDGGAGQIGVKLQVI